MKKESKTDVTVHVNPAVIKVSSRPARSGSGVVLRHRPGMPLRFSVSLVTQGQHQFYTFTMYSDVLARTCFVTTAEEDPDQGFQRTLNADRAQEIANYIDQGLGSIPSSIVLSAQPDADFKVVDGGKTIEFKDTRKAFLILDGQHRVYGFSKSTTRLRVPVVVYNNLTRSEETRLFIDINTKQRPVPNELLLAIKKLAEYENDTEAVLNSLFERFCNDSGSPLVGLLSSSTRARKKLSRVTFYAALKPLISSIAEVDQEDAYNALKSYVQAFQGGCVQLGHDEAILNPIVFRASMLLFKEAAQRVKDRYNGVYSWENFAAVLDPMFTQLKPISISKPGNSYKLLHDSMVSKLKSKFTL